MLKDWRSAFSCLTYSERKRSLNVLALMVLMAFFDVVDLAGSRQLRDVQTSI